MGIQLISPHSVFLGGDKAFLGEGNTLALPSSEVTDW